MGARFSEVVTTEAEIHAAIGHSGHRVRTKAVAVLDDHCRAFIAKSPFLFIASCDADGNMDVSPKGDPPGFVRVLDESTLAIPDRPGNRRADTFSNLRQRPHVGLLFLIPGRPDTLRVNGSAFIVRDQWLRDQMAVGGKAPDLALVVNIQEVFFHCPKCVVRSKLWDSAQWPDLTGLASFAQMKVERGRLEVSVEEMETLVAKNTRERLY
ncbi:MAG: pyridoxamine 5'-phosphate oxidase family protein [Betaproteobacteria bacterium]|nr:pyridoxamine 5'-phosphate oxidase family protein [Betaproteobacteria bacterium]